MQESGDIKAYGQVIETVGDDTSPVIL